VTEYASLSDPAVQRALGNKPEKFRSRWTEAHGFKFQSGHEAKVYGELVLRQRAGEIRSLRRQVRYRLKVNGRLIVTLIADFVYRDLRENRVVCADAKSAVTRRLERYRIKARLFEALTGRQIVEL
jgi:hypothetical protein